MAYVTSEASCNSLYTTHTTMYIPCWVAFWDVTWVRAVTSCWRWLLVGGDFLLAVTSCGGGFLWRWLLVGGDFLLAVTSLSAVTSCGGGFLWRWLLVAVASCWRWLLVGGDFLLAVTSCWRWLLVGSDFLWRWWLKASHSEQMRPCLTEREYTSMTTILQGYQV